MFHHNKPERASLSLKSTEEPSQSSGEQTGGWVTRTHRRRKPMNVNTT